MIPSVLARQPQRGMEDYFCTTHPFANEPCDGVAPDPKPHRHYLPGRNRQRAYLASGDKARRWAR